jgi:metal-responsive CopG/Arc/MetJ family transcriptional regulator
MSRKTDTLLVHVRLDEELLERIDTFRFENRFNDRTRAIRWLLKWALNNCAKAKQPAEPMVKAP